MRKLRDDVDNKATPVHLLAGEAAILAIDVQQQCILAIEAMVPPAELDAWPTVVEPELARLLLAFQKASIKHT